jgi:hypothetical protein
VAVLADDDVVVHGDAERSGHIDDGLGHLDVRARGRRIPGGMIVHQWFDSGDYVLDALISRGHAAIQAYVREVP